MRDALRDRIAQAGRDGPPFGAHPAYRVEPALYLDQPEQALALYAQVRRSRVFADLKRFALERVECSHLSIRACLAAALRDPRRRRACLREVEREARRMQRESFVSAPASVPGVLERLGGLTI